MIDFEKYLYNNEGIYELNIPDEIYFADDFNYNAKYKIDDKFYKINIFKNMMAFDHMICQLEEIK